jgi:hypothetical protein
MSSLGIFEALKVLDLALCTSEQASFVHSYHPRTFEKVDLRTWYETLKSTDRQWVLVSHAVLPMDSGLVAEMVP